MCSVDSIILGEYGKVISADSSVATSLLPLPSAANTRAQYKFKTNVAIK